ncbi:hypothetical protein DFQ01_14439 [Paenibacillus cellulosilyticus]|uniref:Uncharacterized protein n=1 Tax=Paenibacillus cellulosilyticus TaxID=375489 RepID=A0A2V2YN41_9BACL|nr:hypothetical protein [Paenibacillus cellulosilyticus]PWV90263.1 hypothetical protein DFQ01_14439 [Paenibacillus cellulosilyticus]QKS43421.1 hypothetical protein HUB94_02550 [Paenibacillus cellulosilyticus]
MPTIQQLLNTIDTTYRNSYSIAQKVEWMDVTQCQIFQKVPKEAPPDTFPTQAGVAFYQLPSNCDRFGIKQVMIKRSVGSSGFSTLPYLSIESGEQIGSATQFYSLLEDQLFINPMPTETDEGKAIYLIYNKRPAALSASDLTVTPDLEEDFQELLVLGCLERIARARGEIDDKNNFATDYNALLADYERQYKLRQPEYYTPRDVLPRRRGQWSGGRGTRSSSVADLIPSGL